ncbi:MAG TPA: hypothetical protein VGJ13_15620 [Pseudonocardiaceae bacterium]|jgi:hypothetical protein
MTVPRTIPACPALALPACLALMLGVSVLLAPAAAAHDVSGHGAAGEAADARSSVVADDLPPGVRFEVLQNGLALRLRNDSSAVVRVREPPLPVAPGHSVQWHVDAAHPSAGPHPPVQPWRVVIEVNGVAHQVLGEVRWTPGPSPWPWLAGAALLAAGLAGTAWRWRGPAWLAMPLGLAVLASIGHTGAALAARTAEGSRWALLGGYLPQAGCWVLGTLAVLQLGRGRTEGAGLGALAAAGLVVITLARDGVVLGAPVVLVSLPAALDRVLVAGIIGLSAGVLAGLLLTRSIERRTPSAAAS